LGGGQKKKGRRSGPNSAVNGSPAAPYAKKREKKKGDAHISRKRKRAPKKEEPMPAEVEPRAHTPLPLGKKRKNG